MIVEIETDKITLEIPAPSGGTLSEIKVQEGKDVNVGGILAIIVLIVCIKIILDLTLTPKELYSLSF